MKPNLFEFTDYRKFINVFYHAKKAESPAFSFQVFCDKAGFPNKGFVHNVIHGVKNLSRTSAMKFAEAMELTKTEADYFEHLVFFNQARTFKERDHYFEKLNSVRPMTTAASIAKLVRSDQFDFYSKWYHSAVRSIIDLFPVKDDYKWIAKNMQPRISRVLVRQAVDLMLKLGLIERQKNGVLKVKDKVITTGPEAQSLAVGRFHLEMMKSAALALKEIPADKRHITGLTLGISQKVYAKITEEILAFQDKIMEIAKNDTDSDGVYQLNFHFFPLTKTPIERKRV